MYVELIITMNVNAQEYYCIALPNKESESATLNAVTRELASKEEGGDLAGMCVYLSCC